MLNLIQIQDRYIETINAGISRWAHRPKPLGRIAGGPSADSARRY